jgi:hypothetical protein
MRSGAVKEEVEMEMVRGTCDEGVVAGEVEVLQACEAGEMHEERRAVLVHVGQVEVDEALWEMAEARG